VTARTCTKEVVKVRYDYHPCHLVTGCCKESRAKSLAQKDVEATIICTHIMAKPCLNCNQTSSGHHPIDYPAP
jgi:hypothetical protein